MNSKEFKGIKKEFNESDKYSGESYGMQVMDFSNPLQTAPIEYIGTDFVSENHIIRFNKNGDIFLAKDGKETPITEEEAREYLEGKRLP